MVAQEASALVDLLCDQNSNVLDRILALVDLRTQDQLRSLHTRDRVTAIVDYFKTSDSSVCRRFLQIILQYCDNIPFLLETTLLSVSENASGKSCSVLVL